VRARVARCAAVFQLPVRAGVAVRAEAFHLAVRAGVAVRAAVFPPPVRAGVARRAAVFTLAVRACVARRAAVFTLAVRAWVARRAEVFPLAVRAGVAVRAVAFPLPVRAGVAVRAVTFPLPVRAGGAHRAVEFLLAVPALRMPHHSRSAVALRPLPRALTPLLALRASLCARTRRGSRGLVSFVPRFFKKIWNARRQVTGRAFRSTSATWHLHHNSTHHARGGTGRGLPGRPRTACTRLHDVFACSAPRRFHPPRAPAVFARLAEKIIAIGSFDGCR